MKKEYTKPTVVKVKLSHEQAVLGACSSIATKTDTPGTYCYTAHATCKTGGTSGDSLAAS